MIKLLGAVLIIAGCAGVSYCICRNHRLAERMMTQLVGCLEWMTWELNDRMPPLNMLCRGAAQVGKNGVGRVFDRLAQELEAQITPNVAACMGAALAAEPSMPEPVKNRLQELGRDLGKFDLQSQVAALETVCARCRRDAQELGRNRQLRLRNCQTLGLCAGVALVILFL